MFTGIRLRNFKSYRDSGEVHLRPLTLIVGPNNAGKSTLFDAILALKQTTQDRSPKSVLITSGPYADLGGFYDIIHGGRATKNQTVSIALTLSPHDRPDVGLEIHRAGRREKSKPQLTRPEKVNQTLSLSFAFDEKANRVKVQRAELFDGRDPVIRVRPAGLGWTAAGVSSESRKHFEVDFSHFFPVLRPYGKEPAKIRVMREVLNLLLKSRAYATAWDAALENVRHIAPLRTRVPWFGVTGRMPASELGPGGENLLRVMASSVAPPESKRSLRELVNEWLCNRFGMLRRLRLIDVDRAGTIVSLVGDEVEGVRGINVAAMGEGISQLLPIVARVSLASAGECLLIEQPELHLHPAAQADLGDLFAESIRRNPRRQFIIETHSEHVLLRVRRRIADGSIKPDSVAILFVEKRRGQSVVRTLHLNEYGHFDEWPEGFFEEGYREAMMLAEESAQRRTVSRPK